MARGSTVYKPRKVTIPRRGLVQLLYFLVCHGETRGLSIIGLTFLIRLPWIQTTEALKPRGHHLLRLFVVKRSSFVLGLGFALRLSFVLALVALLAAFAFSFRFSAFSATVPRRLSTLLFSLLAAFPFSTLGWDRTLRAVVASFATVPAKTLLTNSVKSTSVTKPGLFLKETDACHKLLPRSRLAVQHNVVPALRVDRLQKDGQAIRSTRLQLRKTMELLVNFAQFILQETNHIKWPLVHSGFARQLQGFVPYSNSLHP